MISFRLSVVFFLNVSKKGFSEYGGNKYTSVLTLPTDVPNDIIPKSDLEKRLAEYGRASSGLDRKSYIFTVRRR
jgi:hypothetical protein